MTAAGQPRVLLIDDNPEDRILALRELRRAIPDLESLEVTDPAEFDRVMGLGGFDVVVTDLQLQWSTGLKVLERVRREWPDCPVIMYTGSGSEEVAAAATRAGLFDYVVKNSRQRARLAAVVRSALDTARQRRALQTAQDLYRTLFEQSQAGVHVGLLGGAILDVNTALVRMFGYRTAEELRGRLTRDLFADPTVYAKCLGQLEQQGEVSNIEALGRRSDGSTFPLLYSSRIHRTAGQAIVISTAIDHTEQQRARDDLMRAAVEWRTTFDGISSPILVARRDATVVRINAAGRALAGESYDELVGRGLGHLAPEEPWRSAAELVGTTARRESPITSTVRDPTTGFTWEISAFPGGRLDDPDRLITLVLRDITEVVDLQETLVRNQTMSALGQLIAGVAHEVRSPLFGISATLDAFEARFGAQAQFHSYLENLRRELGRMNDLMRDLLELGKPASTPRRPEPVATLVQEALEASRSFAAQRGVTLTIGFEPAVQESQILADRRRLVQVFENLLKNALQHAPAGTEVLVHGDRLARGDATELVVTVLDRGPGFRPEDLPRAFDPFFTRRSGGTGLGLAIVLRIVEDHGGAVAVANRLGGGASVRVSLPEFHPQPDPT